MIESKEQNMIKIFTVLKVLGFIVITGTWMIPSDTEGLHILVLLGTIVGGSLITIDLVREIFWIKPEEESTK